MYGARGGLRPPEVNSGQVVLTFMPFALITVIPFSKVVFNKIRSILIDRNDHVVNLCEIKFYNAPIILTKAEAEKLRNRMGVFRQVTGIKKQVFITYLTAFGLMPNKHSLGLVDKVLAMDFLFEEIDG